MTIWWFLEIFYCFEKKEEEKKDIQTLLLITTGCNDIIITAANIYIFYHI